MVFMARSIQQTLLVLIVDLLLVVAAFLLAVWLKPGAGAHYITRYQWSFCIFLAVWAVISAAFRKYRLMQQKDLKEILTPVILSNLAVLGVVVSLMYFLRVAYYSRFIVFGTIMIATAMELFLGNIYYFIHRAGEVRIQENGEFRGLGLTVDAEKLEGLHDEEVDFEEPEVKEYIKKTIIDECGEEGFHFLNRKVLLNDKKTLILSTTSLFNIEAKPPGVYKTVVNMRRINDIRRINKFFETINQKLPVGGTFIGCVETKDMRKQRIFRKFWKPFNVLFYYFIDFPIKRVFPKFAVTKQIYFILTRGNNRVISRAETLGRLVSCGYEISDEGFIGPLFYFVCRKLSKPLFDKAPSYGPFVRLRRIGRDGKIIRVLKMRTMHPYAEYLQEYLYRKHHLQNGGKFNNDFRVSTQGKIMRRFWIDELPMLYNWFKGEMKLVGVRPLSEHYFSLYNHELQQKRITHKPGLIPPFYADLPETLEEIQESEMRYLVAYEKHPFRTDWKYFWKAIYNILFRNARSS